MAIYRNTVLHGAVEALRANYPVVEEMVGREMFERVAVDYATECPPRHPSLALYGARFAQWLEGQRWIQDVPYLADVARVERLRIESLMAADATALSRSDIAERKLDELRMRLHPALRFTWLATPAMSIWLAHQRHRPTDLNLAWKAEGALFARPRHDILHCPRIGRSAHRMLCGISIGETAGQAIGAANRLYPDDDARVVLLSLLRLGSFSPTAERTIQ